MVMDRGRRRLVHVHRHVLLHVMIVMIHVLLHWVAVWIDGGVVDRRVIVLLLHGRVIVRDHVAHLVVSTVATAQHSQERSSRGFGQQIDHTDYGVDHTCPVSLVQEGQRDTYLKLRAGSPTTILVGS